MNPLIVCASLVLSLGSLRGDAGLGAVTAVVHAALESTEPAAGDTITAYPSVIRLVFSEPIESEFSNIILKNGAGTIWRLSSRTDPRNVYALIADFPQVPPGGYLVSWRVVSADGHPVGGYFQFYVAVSAEGHAPEHLLAGAPPAPPIPTDAPAGGPIGTSGEPPIVSALIRAGAQMTLLALTGLLILLTWGGAERSGRLGHVERILVVSTPVLLAADFLLWLQHAAPQGSVTFATVLESLGTQNGAGYALRVGFALVAAWALLLARAPGLASIFMLLALIASGSTGHPAAIRPSIAIPGKIVHLSAAALWTGGLLALALGDRTAEGFRQDASRVSRIALVAVIAIAVTGAVEALLFLPSVWDLFRSTYGWLIIAKLAGLAVLVAFGARNRFQLMPRLAENGPKALRRSVSWEIGWMAAVVVLAGFLAYIPPPPGAGMAMPVTHHHQIEEP